MVLSLAENTKRNYYDLLEHCHPESKLSFPNTATIERISNTVKMFLRLLGLSMIDIGTIVGGCLVQDYARRHIGT